MVEAAGPNDEEENSTTTTTMALFPSTDQRCESIHHLEICMRVYVLMKHCSFLANLLYRSPFALVSFFVLLLAFFGRAMPHS